MEIRPGPSTVARRAEDAVELLHGHALERAILVDEDDRRVFPAGDVVRTGDGRDSHRIVAENALVGQQIVESRIVTHHQVRLVEVQRRECRGGRRRKERELDAGLKLREAFLPVFPEQPVRQIIAAADAYPARELLTDLEMPQPAQVEFLGVVRLAAAFVNNARPLRLALQRFSGIFGRLRDRIRWKDERNQRCVGDGAECWVIHHFSIASSFASCARATSAVSGRYLPSRMSRAWPSWLTTKRKNSRTFGSIGFPGVLSGSEHTSANRG